MVASASNTIHSFSTNNLFDIFLMKLVSMERTLRFTFLKYIVIFMAKIMNKRQNKMLQTVIAVQLKNQYASMDLEERAAFKEDIFKISEDIEHTIETLSLLQSDIKEIDTLYTTALKLENELAFLQAKL